MQHISLESHKYLFLHSIYNMYCDLSNAYENICDLTHSQTNCVYDNIVNDGVDTTKDNIPRNMFTAQGDYYEYSPIHYSEDVINKTNAILDGDADEKGTPIEELIKKQELDEKMCAVCRPNDSPQNNSVRIGNENKNVASKNYEHNLEQETSNVRIKKIVRDAIEEHFTNSKSPRTDRRPHFSSQFSSIINSDIIDAMLITFIGVIIIFLLDILIKISKKL